MQHELRMSEFLKKNGQRMTSHADGYYSEKDYRKQKLKEYTSFIRGELELLSSQETFDMLRFIALVLPEISDPKDRIIVEKYLMGFSIREICSLIGFSSKSSVHKRLKKYESFLREKLEDAIALRELFENRTYEYREPAEGIRVEKDIARARIFLENVMGFETMIYPYDISAFSYKITVKHPQYGTQKFSCDGFLKFVNHIKEKITSE